MTSLKTRVGAGIGAVALALGAAVTLPGTASAATNCQGGTSSSRCVTTTNVAAAEVVLDQVPLTNSSPYVATMSCSFSGTVTATLTTSVTVSAGITAQIPLAVEATAGVSASVEVSATASATTTAAGSVELQPGQSVTCQRVATVYTTTVRSFSSNGSSILDDQTFTAQVPSLIGARIV